MVDEAALMRLECYLQSMLKVNEQASAKLGQAQPVLGLGENNLSLRGYIWVWG